MDNSISNTEWEKVKKSYVKARRIVERRHLLVELDMAIDSMKDLPTKELLIKCRDLLNEITI